jgi:hypothetical protein
VIDAHKDKPKKNKKPEPHPALLQDLPARLAELEAEIRLYPTRTESSRPLKSIKKPSEEKIDKERVIQFEIGKHTYGAGHTDAAYPDTNHARGVRHVRYYVAEKVVLDIEGDYEDQQFGSNFRFQNIDLYVPGEWEKDFVKLTDQLRAYKDKRKELFRRKRAATHGWA